MGAIMDEATVTAVLKSFPYPCFVMEGMKMLPRAAVSATAAPEMPPKMMLVTMFTWASPPLSRPKKRLAKSTSRVVSPTLFMMSPASRKKGRARKVKLSMAENIRWEIMERKTVLSV